MQHDKPEKSSPASSAGDTLKNELARCRSELAQARAQAKAMADVFMHLADATFIVERDATIIDANPAACALLGYSREELLRMYPWDFVISASREEILTLTQGLQPGEVATVQRTYRRHDQGRLLIDLRLIRCNLGGRDLIMVSCRDVTARELASEALSRSENHQRQLLDSIPGLVWSAKAMGEVEYHNKRWTDYTGLTVEQANGWGWQSAIYPADLPKLVSQWKTLLATGSAGEGEARLRRHDGVYRWYLFRGVPVRDDAGTLIGWFGMNTDIEDRKWAEFLLAAEKRVLEMIAQGMALSEVFAAICLAVDEMSPDVRSLILDFEAQSRSPRSAIAPGFGLSSEAVPPPAHLLPPDALLQQTCANMQPLIVGNLAQADQQDDQVWREHLLREGFQACWLSPILSSGGAALGTFVIYSRLAGEPGSQHSKMMEQITHLTAIAIERAHAQTQLRRSELSLATAQCLSATGSFSWFPLSGEITCSSETRRICGLAPDETPDLNAMLALVHPNDLDRLRTTLAQAQHDMRVKFRLCQSDGRLRHLEVVARAVLNECGLIVEWAGAVMDVTEHQRTQETIRHAKARFEGIVKIADDAIISTDARQRISLFNQGAEKVFGYTAEEVIGQPLGLLLPPRLQPPHAAHVAAFARSAEVTRGMGERREVLGLRKDGREFPAEASISRLDLSGEQIFTVILRDITERRCAAEALRAAGQLARGQVEALTHTVDALAIESEPERIAEHVLRTITSQLGALGCSLWRREEDSGLVAFAFAFEHGRVVMPTDPKVGPVSPPLRIDDVWPWPEVFRTGKPYLLEDIREDVRFPWRDHVLALGVISILIVPMLVSGEVEGVIGIRFASKRNFSADEMDLAQALANLAMLALQLTRMSVHNRSAAVLAERNRMARDIHDTLAQGFTGVIVQLEAAADASGKGLSEEARAHMLRAADLARESLREARRSVQALRPQALQEKTLCEALASLVHKMTLGTPLKAVFSVEGELPSLPSEWEENLLRIGQEVLTNSLRHAQANQFSLRLAFDQSVVRMRMHDDGNGFDARSKHDGFGLLGIRERVTGMGGQVSIYSTPGSGTTIQVALPYLASENSEQRTQQ